MKDLTKNDRVRTVNDLMTKLEQEITQIKSGKLKEEKARLVMRGRALQMKGADLFLQACRLENRIKGRPGTTQPIPVRLTA